jgi:hypothetical protein
MFRRGRPACLPTNMMVGLELRGGQAKLYPE